MAFRERTKVNEYTSVAISSTDADLPERMQCPQGHFVRRFVVVVEHDTARIDLPGYACFACQAIYRYQECTNPNFTSPLRG